MSSSITQYEEIKALYEFQKDMIKSLITQILKSPELTSQTNKLSLAEKKKYQEDVDKLANKVIEKEIRYYEKRYNLKNPDDFAKIIDKLSEKRISEIRRKMCNEVIGEIDS